MELEYIIRQCKKAHYSGWLDDAILKECINKLNTLSDKELCDLLFEKDVHAEWSCFTHPDKEFDEAIEHNKRVGELKSAIVRTIPTSKLVETMYWTIDDYNRKHLQDSYSDCQEAFRAAYDCARDELRRRYIVDIDSNVIENAFNHTTSENKEWIKWQKKKRKVAEKRYQDSFLKKFKDCEIFANEEVVDGGILGYDKVISIKGCRNFWDEDGKRISAVNYILYACGTTPQLIGLGDEVVLAVASDYHMFDSVYDDLRRSTKSPQCNKIDEILRKEYNKDFVLGCMLVEMFIHIIAPRANVKVRCYGKDYLLGRFVAESANELFSAINSIEEIKELAPMSKKMDDFIDLLSNLLNPSGKGLFI